MGGAVVTRWTGNFGDLDYFPSRAVITRQREVLAYYTVSK